MANDPEKVKISDGLAKFFEAADLISEQKMKELAEKSRYEAMKIKKEKEGKLRDGRVP